MKTTKNSVKNPIEYFTTIGEEIEDMLQSNEISIDDFLFNMKWDVRDLKSVNKISKNDALKIEYLFKIDSLSSYILNFQEEYNESNLKAQLIYKSNLKIFKKVQHLMPLLRNEFNDGIDILDDISNFLDIEEETEILDRVKENIALYKISNFVPNDLNLYAWLKRGQLDFYQKQLQEYNSDLFMNWIERREWQHNLVNTEYIKGLPKLLEQFGVGLVCTPYLEKTVFGAVRWFENKPLIQISDKGKCLATFWYTLFHEFGHVIKHENDEIFEGQADLTKSSINKKEKEANAFAYEYLFNGDNLRKHIFGYNRKNVEDNFIEDKARRFNVNPMFVVYWMKKANVRCKSNKFYTPSFTIEIEK